MIRLKPIHSLSLLAIFIFTSCEFTAADTAEKPKKEPVRNGKVVVENKRSNTTTEANFKDGKMDGLNKQFYSDGKVWKESMYKEGKLHGTAKVYDQQGRLEREVNYENGTKHGKYLRYFKSGKPSLEIEYDHGRPLPGYIERNYKGEEKDDPKILFERIDKMAAEQVYEIKVRLSEPHKNTHFYAMDDPAKYQSDELPRYRIYSEGNEGVLQIKVPPGYFYANEVHFFVQYDLGKGIEVVKHQPLNIAVENTL